MRYDESRLTGVRHFIMDNGQRDMRNLGGGGGDDGRANRFRRARGHLWARVGRGFIVIIPLLITFIILRYLIVLVEAVFAPLVGVILEVPVIGEIPAAVAIVWFAVLALALSMLYLLGSLVSGEKGRRRVTGAISGVAGRIPVFGSIYGAARQATEALSAPREQAFSRVIFLEWPRPDVHAMGLVTGRCAIPGDDRTMLVVYIATVPNPTSGMLAIVPEEDAIDSNMSVEDAMKIIFSGGIVLPDGMKADSPLELPVVGDYRSRTEDEDERQEAAG